MADSAEPTPQPAGQQPPLAIPAHSTFLSLSTSSSAASSPRSLAGGAAQPVPDAYENVVPQYAHIDRHRIAPSGSAAADSSAPSSSYSSGGAMSSFYGNGASFSQMSQLHSSASSDTAQHSITGGEQSLQPPPSLFTTSGDDGLVPATSSLDVSSASSLNASYEKSTGPLVSGGSGDGYGLALHESTPYQHSQEMFAHWPNASAQPPTSHTYLAAPVPTHPHTSLFDQTHEGYAQPYHLHPNPHGFYHPAAAGPSHAPEAMTSAPQSQHHLARYDTHHVNSHGYITAPADYYDPMGHASSLQSQYAPHFHSSVSPDQRMEQQQRHLPYDNPHNMPAASYLAYEQHGPMHVTRQTTAQSEYPVFRPTAQAPTSYAGERGLPVSYTAADYATMHQTDGFSRHAFAQLESHPLPVRPNYLQHPSFGASETGTNSQNPAFAIASTSAGPPHAFFPSNPEQMQASHNGSSGRGPLGPEQHGINVMVGGQYFSNLHQDTGPLTSPHSRGQSKSVSSYDVQQQSYLGAPQPSPTWTQGSLISPAASNFPQSGTPQAGQGILSTHDYFGHLPQISPRDLTSEWQPSLLPYQSQIQHYPQDNDLAGYNGQAISYASGATVQPTQPPSQQAQPLASTAGADPPAAVRPKRSRANSKKNPKGEEKVPTATSGSTDDSTTSKVSLKVPPLARKETRVHDGVCMACGKIFATINLRGHPEDFQTPFTLQYHCLDCAPASLGVSRAALQATVGSSLTSTANSKETFKGSPTASDTSDTSDPDPKSLKVVTKGPKKRMRPTDVSSATVCDVCSRWLAHGAPITEESGAELGFNVEIVCTLCSDKYRRCSDCGGGGGARLGVGKWRCKELFSPGRKTCDLSHARQSSITSMEYCTTRIRDIPTNEREELIAKCKGVFEAALYSSLAVPEVLERGTAMATTYEDVTRRVTEGWDDAVRNLMDDIESIDHVRRYVGLRWSAPRPRKIAGIKKAGKQAEGPSSPNTKSEPHSGAKAVLRSNMNLSGYVSGEWDIYGGTFYITVSVPYSTGEQYEGSAHLIGLLQKRIMQERQEIIDKFTAEAKLMTYLESKRQLIPLDRYVQKYPDTDVTVFPPHRKSYIRSKEQKHWTVLVRRLHPSSTPTPGPLDNQKLGQIPTKQPKPAARSPAKVAAAEGA